MPTKALSGKPPKPTGQAGLMLYPDRDRGRGTGHGDLFQNKQFKSGGSS
jgi:hypothetical protein